MRIDSRKQGEGFRLGLNLAGGHGHFSGSNLSPETSKEVLSLIRDTGLSRWFWTALVIVPPLTALAARAPEIICAARGLEGCA